MAQLQVTIVEAMNLKKKDLFSNNDPYVEIYLDDKKQKQKTSVKHNSKAPVWNETFVFNHTRGQDILHVDVYDEDPFRNDKIGSVAIDLRDVYQKRRLDSLYTITSKFLGSSKGEIRLILDYQPLQI